MKSSGRYQKLPQAVNLTTIAGIPQEFLVSRSFGPNPEDVRSLDLKEIFQKRKIEIVFEFFIIICLLISVIASYIFCGYKVDLNKDVDQAIRIIGLITLFSILMVTLLLILTNYKMCARHLAFLFVPLFLLAAYPIINGDRPLIKITFFLPLFLLWSWSSANQIFDSSYMTDDYRGAAVIIEDKMYDASKVIAMCHPKALKYYGINRPLVYIQPSHQVTAATLTAYLEDNNKPVWLIISRPWDYPSFYIKELKPDFQVLQTRQLPGIVMRLIILGKMTESSDI